MNSKSKIDVWEIVNDIYNDVIPLLCYRNNNTYLLNTTNVNMNILEKIVFELSMFHLNRLNIKYDKEEHFIEFWWKNKLSMNNKLHIDCDEYERIYNNTVYNPLCSTVTYLNDNEFPTLITNVNYEEYKYKEFPCEKELILSIPKKGKHIAFDGKYYHGECNITNSSNFDTDRYILAINIWDRKPSYVPYYDSLNYVNVFLKNVSKNIIEYSKYNTNINIIELIESNEKIITNEVEPALFDKNMYDILLYDKTQNILNHTFQKLNNIIKDIPNNTIHIKYKKETNKNKSINDIQDLFDNNISVESIFNKIEIFNNIYSIEICNWIINESENYAKLNGGWTTKRHINYPTTDLPLENITPIFNFVISTIEFIFPKIQKLYNLPANVSLDIHDLFIVKYEENLQTELEYHRDGSHISFNILLNNEHEFEGGGTHFQKEDKIIKLKQTDMLVHCSKLFHSGIKITKGKRYLLVCFINLQIA
jgi:hypothetical protein